MKIIYLNQNSPSSLVYLTSLVPDIVAISNHLTLKKDVVKYSYSSQEFPTFQRLATHGRVVSEIKKR